MAGQTLYSIYAYSNLYKGIDIHIHAVIGYFIRANLPKHKDSMKSSLFNTRNKHFDITTAFPDCTKSLIHDITLLYFLLSNKFKT